VRCAHCGSDNKRSAKFCSDCGAALQPAPAGSGTKQTPPVQSSSVEEPSGPFWQPDRKWHLKALLSIYAALVVIFFVVSLFLSKVPEPYRMRDIPKEMTPWLKK
jgi:uncharacterized membrane protein YvbJ